MEPLNPIIVYLNAAGAATAARAAAALRAETLGPEVGAAEMRAVFAAGRPLIGVCAAGVLIRALGGLAIDKWREPPVVALSVDGRHAVPLLGGHHGANALARSLAEALGGTAAVTTASESVAGVALDEPPAGWRLANPGDVKSFAARMLDGEGARLCGEAAGAAEWLYAPPAENVASLRAFATAKPQRGDAKTLVFHPQSHALGVGCARGAPLDELAALAETALERANLAVGALAGVFSIDVKADEAAVHGLAERFGVPARFFTAEELEAEAARLANPSKIVFAEVGCHGVAEGAALAAVGPEGRLKLEKLKSANATCALAEAPEPLALPPGRARGRLSVVGIGPGAADWRTPEASRAIAEADELVGYSLYLDLLGPLAKGKTCKRFPLGGEEDRCRYALERAGEGRRVALVSSGDGGIYAMGALVMELLERPREAGGVSPQAARVELRHAPGITALQAASARVGAMIGHDFCAISLSDLLTPREDIIRRIEAAAAGDFVIAFYNPVSKRRRALLGEAREILLAHRPAETPVLIAANLGREDERLRHRILGALEVDEVDMLSLVLVGSSATRTFGERSGATRIYTPRGYANKRETP